MPDEATGIKKARKAISQSTYRGQRTVKGELGVVSLCTGDLSREMDSLMTRRHLLIRSLSVYHRLLQPGVR